VTPGEARLTTLFDGPEWTESRASSSLADAFSSDSSPWRLEPEPAPHVAVGCVGRQDAYHLLMLQPIALASRGVCLAWVECRVARRRGEPSGLYWGTFREHPSHPESIVAGGSALVPEATDDWVTLSATIPVTQGAEYLSIGVGGRRNEGTQLWVRRIRVVMIPESDR
jgi:hypothetical protein